jgi:hypothetical protein
MKRFLVLVLALVMVLGFAGFASASPYIWFDANGDMVPDTEWIMEPCDVVWLEVYISGVPTPGLISMGLIASYDPDQLEVTTGTGIYRDNWWFGPLNLSPGVVDMVGGRLYPGLSGDDIHLGTIELHCIEPGVSSITLTDHDAPYDDFVLADGRVLDNEILYGSIEITNVPIPGTLLLLGSGLLGIIGLGRRRIIERQATAKNL